MAVGCVADGGDSLQEQFRRQPLEILHKALQEKQMQSSNPDTPSGIDRTGSSPQLLAEQPANGVELENQRLREEIRSMCMTIKHQSGALSKLWTETQARPQHLPASPAASREYPASASRLGRRTGVNAASTSAELAARSFEPPSRSATSLGRSASPAREDGATATEGLACSTLGRFPRSHRLPLFSPNLGSPPKPRCFFDGSTEKKAGSAVEQTLPCSSAAATRVIVGSSPSAPSAQASPFKTKAATTPQRTEAATTVESEAYMLPPGTPPTWIQADSPDKGYASRIRESSRLRAKFSKVPVLGAASIQGPLTGNDIGIEPPDPEGRYRAGREGGLDLHFDGLDLHRVSRPDFTKDLLHRLRTNGASESLLRDIRIDLKNGSVVAEIRCGSQRSAESLRRVVRAKSISICGCQARVVEVPADDEARMATIPLPRALMAPQGQSKRGTTRLQLGKTKKAWAKTEKPEKSDKSLQETDLNDTLEALYRSQPEPFPPPLADATASDNTDCVGSFVLRAGIYVPEAGDINVPEPQPIQCRGLPRGGRSPTATEFSPPQRDREKPGTPAGQPSRLKALPRAALDGRRAPPARRGSRGFSTRQAGIQSDDELDFDGDSRRDGEQGVSSSSADDGRSKEENHHAISFETHLEEHSLSSFRESTQQQFCAHIAKNLGCDRVEIVSMKDGSVIVHTCAVGFVNSDHISSAKDKVHGGRALDEEVWGRCRIFKLRQCRKVHRASPWLQRRMAGGTYEEADTPRQQAEGALKDVAHRPSAGKRTQELEVTLYAAEGQKAKPDQVQAPAPPAPKQLPPGRPEKHVETGLEAKQVSPQESDAELTRAASRALTAPLPGPAKAADRDIPSESSKDAVPPPPQSKVGPIGVKAAAVGAAVAATAAGAAVVASTASDQSKSSSKSEDASVSEENDLDATDSEEEEEDEDDEDSEGSSASPAAALPVAPAVKVSDPSQAATKAVTFPTDASKPSTAAAAKLSGDNAAPEGKEPAGQADNVKARERSVTAATTHLPESDSEDSEDEYEEEGAEEETPVQSEAEEVDDDDASGEYEEEDGEEESLEESEEESEVSSVAAPPPPPKQPQQQRVRAETAPAAARSSAIGSFFRRK
eukprot:TRINITY_DN19255_c0_g1_i4.p1 TRINITY_DN19255_c0_g1~~TRINITY_DN19255_c0_g1_i4.p1  ORF type:complete len:1114 (+),score=287.90 TRINITY_DN19255_c0_g1_i4:136-3477(+)